MNRSKIAKKKFGQNFLVDQSIVQQIIQSIPNSGRKIAEIGPGLGDLTKVLLPSHDVTAFEVDTDLCTHLRQSFSNYIEKETFRLVCGDVLENWQEAGLMAEPYDLIANLPYYIATNIILRGLADPQCKTMLVMVQEEVAEKFSAQEGEKAFNSLSVLAQNVAKVSIVVRVPPTAFEPAPKINSAVLLIEKHADHTDKELETFLAYAFKQPRKTLLKNLSVCCDKTLLKEHFSTLGIDEKIRPHQLSLASYHQLYDIYRSLDGRTKQ